MKTSTIYLLIKWSWEDDVTEGYTDSLEEAEEWIKQDPPRRSYTEVEKIKEILK